MSANTIHSTTSDRSQDIDRDYRRQQRNTLLFALLFLLPGMLIFFAFLLFPVSNSLYYSLFKWNGLGPPTDFVGLKNYDFLLNQNAFWMAIRNSITIVVLSLTVQLPFALTIALLVGRGKLPGRGFFRTILFVPFVFAEVLTALIWVFIFSPREGLANFLVHLIAPNADNLVWLADKNLALLSVFIVITWKFFGLHMILYMAALQGVPSDMEEAARIDGATEWQVLRYITIPMIGPTIRLTIYLSVLGSFQQFVLIWIMTEGGPANATHVLATYLYKFGIISWRLGLGSAIAVMLFIITFAFSIFYQIFVMRQDYTGDRLKSSGRRNLLGILRERSRLLVYVLGIGLAVAIMAWLNLWYLLLFIPGIYLLLRLVSFVSPDFWWTRIIKYIILTVLSVIMLLPVAVAVLGGMRTTGEIFERPFGLPQAGIQWENYTRILTDPGFYQFARNSFVITFGVVILNVILASMLAFVFSRVKFRSRSIWFNILSIGLLFPLVVAILPIFIQIRNFGLTGNLFGVILPLVAFGLPASVVILRGFFIEIPNELEESAYIDGATRFQFFWRILVPIARPAIFAVATIQIIVAWNEYFLPLVVLTSNTETWPLPMGLMQFRGQYGTDWAAVMAYITILMVPAVIFFIFTQRFIVTGLTGGELKG